MTAKNHRKKLKKEIAKNKKVLKQINALVPYIPYWHECELIKSEMTGHRALTDSKAGRNLGMTPQILDLFLKALREGANKDEAAREAGLGLTTRDTYLNYSATFAELTSHAQDYPNRMAQKAVVEDIVGVPGHWVERTNPKTKEKEMVYYEAIPPNPIAGQWWLERTDPNKFARKVVQAIHITPGKTDDVEAYAKDQSEQSLYERLILKTAVYERKLTDGNQTRN